MVLTFALVALGVWVVMQILREVITAPEWFMGAVTIGLSALGLWWADYSPLWCFTTAGFVVGWNYVDQLFLFIRDWVKLAPLRGQPRR